MDGLERESVNRAHVIGLDTNRQLGQQIARRYGVSWLPTLLAFDGDGTPYYRKSGPPGRASVLEAIGETGNWNQRPRLARVGALGDSQEAEYN